MKLRTVQLNTCQQMNTVLITIVYIYHFIPTRVCIRRVETSSRHSRPRVFRPPGLTVEVNIRVSAKGYKLELELNGIQYWTE